MIWLKDISFILMYICIDMVFLIALICLLFTTINFIMIEYQECVQKKEDN